ncbi:DUF3823 domain-containing protein [Algoriphagus sp. AGSA1]|uniref:DUF3823 domain-containing protein n=1 Tax=Algoriphagus sp. AGSA1 TaxID=2907213 RepID=UPI001F42865E|nr:DUF3823 domain-containing protein [Algoriphagus sp. AGSA1]MCE7054289.1 DUF3823 domain-containing protein [Algoriphagus sp. AGSA1]
MKNQLYILVLFAVGLFSCELDNYDAPTASISGRFVDAQTGELVEQDLIDGTVIQLAEHGYDPVGLQYLIVKNDGTFENKLLFENMYTVQPVRGNFYPLDEQVVKIASGTTLDFEVTPYLRIVNPQITYSNGIVTATFSIEQTGAANVRKIGLFAHPNPVVGQPVQVYSVENDLNRDVTEDEVFTIEIDVINNSSIFGKYNDFFFRIGAIANAAESKYNYVSAERITL